MLLNCGVGEDSWEFLGLQGDQSILKEINTEYSLEGLMLKLKLQYFWPPDAKSRLIVKDPNGGKDWGQEKKQATEDEMVGWHHPLNGHEFEQTPGDSEGQGSQQSMGLQRVRHDWATELTEEHFGCFQIWQLWIKHKTFMCGFCCGHKLSTPLDKY